MRSVVKFCIVFIVLRFKVLWRMGSGASVLDEEEYKCLLSQIEKGRSIRSSLKEGEEIKPPSSQLKGTITRIAYAAFGVKLENTEKVVYITRFPPTAGTVAPLLDEPSSEYDLKVDDNISLEEATEFWASTDTRQVNGLWKGGSWGMDNLLPHSKWCTDAWVGDTVTFDFVSNGIIKFQMGIPGFPDGGSAEVVKDSANTAWSLNITIDKTGNKYAGYGMNYFLSMQMTSFSFGKTPKVESAWLRYAREGMLQLWTCKIS